MNYLSDYLKKINLQPTKTKSTLDSDKKQDAIDDNIHYSQRFGWTLKKKKLLFKTVDF